MALRRVVIGSFLAAGLLLCALLLRSGVVKRAEVAPRINAQGLDVLFARVESPEGDRPLATRGDYFFPEIMRGGIAVADLDRDGWLELLTFTGAPDAARDWELRVYATAADGRLAPRGEAIACWSMPDVPMGLAVGDVDNDGAPDIYVAAYGRDRLFLNRGDGTFTDITGSSTIDHSGWSTSCSLVDYDRDGWLDLIVASYVDYHPSRQCVEPNGRPDYCNPKLLRGTAARLYHNETGLVSHAGGITGQPSRSVVFPVRFRDVSLESQIALKAGPGLGVCCADMNGDRWPDLLVANDGAANFLWINQHDGTFREEAVARGVAYDNVGRPQANMGIALGDADGDGAIDVVITHLGGEGAALYLGRSGGIFEEAAATAGLLRPSFAQTGFGTALVDLDLDGALDLVIVNGRVKRRDGAPFPEFTADGRAAVPADFWAAYAEQNQIYLNDGFGRFHELQLRDDPFTRERGVWRGLATGDIDNDGDLDLVVTQATGRARVLRTVAPRKGHWIMIRAVEPALGGRDAVGATIALVAGEKRWMRLVSAGGSYLSSSDPRAHFGLGEFAAIDRIDVIWPDGSDETFDGGPVDRFVTIEHGRGRAP